MPAIAVHHTAVVDEAWDGPAAVAAMPNDDAVLRYCHAWQSAEAAGEDHVSGDDDADDRKGSYKFPHHKTKGGPANLAACRNGLARLSGADIPDADRSGVEAHLQAHLDDGAKESKGAATMGREHWNIDTPLATLRERRQTMRGGRERLRRPAQVELRAKPDGTGGTAYSFEGYAAAFEAPFEMWDFWGDPYMEVLGLGSCNRTLANGADVQFLIGHDESSIPLARTKSGTMSLSADSTGLLVAVPSLDGANPMVQALASAMGRGDMDEMSIGFIATQQQWSPDYMERRITEINLNRGDVSMVCWAANPAANGATMRPVQVSEAAARAAGEREARSTPGAGEPEQQAPEPDFSSKPAYDASHHGESSPQCPNPDCQALNSQDAGYCDQCGTVLYDDGGLISDGSLDDVITDASGLIEEEDMTLARMRVRVLQLRG